MFNIDIYIGVVINAKEKESAHATLLKTKNQKGEVITKLVSRKLIPGSLKSAVIQGLIDSILFIKKPSKINVFVLQHGIDTFFDKPTTIEKSFIFLETVNAITHKINFK
jgi:hypothetical protein